MKFNIVKTTISIALSLLISYGLYTCDTSGYELLLSIVGFVEFAIFLIAALGVKVDGVRSMVNSRIIAWLFFILGIVFNIVFAYNGFKVPTFIITNGFILLLFILITYSLLKASK